VENADRFSHSGAKALEKCEARTPNYPKTWEMKKHAEFIKTLILTAKNSYIFSEFPEFRISAVNVTAESINITMK
jgi:hypothetical protein